MAPPPVGPQEPQRTQGPSRCTRPPWSAVHCAGGRRGGPPQRWPTGNRGSWVVSWEGLRLAEGALEGGGGRRGSDSEDGGDIN